MAALNLKLAADNKTSEDSGFRHDRIPYQVSPSTSPNRAETPDPLSSGSKASVTCESHYLRKTVQIEFENVQTSPRTEVRDPYTGLTKPVKKQAPSVRTIGDYQVIRTIGSGSTAKVKLAINIRTSQKVAIKLIDRHRLSEQSRTSKESLASKERRIIREAAILHLLNHPGVVKLHDFLVCQDYFCMIFEFVDGAQMLDYIIAHKKLKEKVARKFFRQMVASIDYCHQNSIVHRDLKIENVLVDNGGNARLVDFGLSNFFDPFGHLGTFCGSLYFAAPELLNGKAYTGPEVDVWSLGVILYVLVCGKVPFDDKSLPALHEKIKACELELPSHLSDECRELLSGMILADPLRRLSMQQVIDHPWTNKGYEERVLNNIPQRRALDFIDGRIVEFLAEEFQIQYSYEDIVNTLKKSTLDWARLHQHPIVSLYFLVKEKLARDEITARIPHPCPYEHWDKKQLAKSSSCPDISPPPTAVPADVLRKDRVTMARSRNLSLNLSKSPSYATASFSIPSGVPLAIERIEEDREIGTLRPQLGSMTIRKRVESLPSPHPSVPKPSSGSRTRSLQVPKEQNEDANPEPRVPQVPRIKTVYLRGFFSVNTTSTKSPGRIIQEIVRALNACRIPYEDRGGYFVCEHGPSILIEGKESSADTRSLPIIFEIHVVRLALLGMHGVQFKRVQGDFSLYKNICSIILDEAKL